MKRQIHKWINIYKNRKKKATEKLYSEIDENVKFYMDIYNLKTIVHDLLIHINENNLYTLNEETSLMKLDIVLDTLYIDFKEKYVESDIPISDFTELLDACLSLFNVLKEGDYKYYKLVHSDYIFQAVNSISILLEESYIEQQQKRDSTQISVDVAATEMVKDLDKKKERLKNRLVYRESYKNEYSIENDIDSLSKVQQIHDYYEKIVDTIKRQEVFSEKEFGEYTALNKSTIDFQKALKRELQSVYPTQPSSNSNSNNTYNYEFNFGNTGYTDYSSKLLIEREENEEE